MSIINDMCTMRDKKVDECNKAGCLKKLLEQQIQAGDGRKDTADELAKVSRNFYHFDGAVNQMHFVIKVLQDAKGNFIE